MKFLSGVLFAVVALALLALAAIYAGTYNIAASAPHTAAGQWLLNTTMYNSVRAHAEDVRPPADFTARQAQDGFRHFRDTCSHCHGAPGVERDEWAQGLRPSPPELSDVVPEWSDGELFWIAKNGIKMTGMPAFGVSYSDEELWSIVAFLDQLPRLTPEQYQRFEEQSAEDRLSEAER